MNVRGQSNLLSSSQFTRVESVACGKKNQKIKHLSLTAERLKSQTEKHDDSALDSKKNPKREAAKATMEGTTSSLSALRVFEQMEMEVPEVPLEAKCFDLSLLKFKKTKDAASSCTLVNANKLTVDASFAIREIMQLSNTVEDCDELIIFYTKKIDEQKLKELYEKIDHQLAVVPLKSHLEMKAQGKAFYVPEIPLSSELQKFRSKLNQVKALRYETLEKLEYLNQAAEKDHNFKSELIKRQKADIAKKMSQLELKMASLSSVVNTYEFEHPTASSSRTKSVYVASNQACSSSEYYEAVQEMKALEDEMVTLVLKKEALN